MTNISPDEEAIFNAARQIVGDPEARMAYLAKTCSGHETLRARVEALLHAHEQQTFLQSPATARPESELGSPILLTPPGTMIGRYKLLEPIGEGGYGAVFMAEQTSPVQRKVALKIIKAGMDTRQVIARFEAERQALALMDHPNIAKVFDAGTTETGRLYFVMELVKGMPITKYCDAHHIEPRQRLELFMQVCQAVQHAHQKGIIHRDLKPSNVLVAQYDGKPVPKVIDFGVAKATGQQLTERTMFTGFGDVIGTLEYMSPEQAEVNQLDVDTRSDIYSLGVLLYELLTGSTPLEHKRVMKGGLLEMLRVVREEEPPRPSMRLSTTEQLPSISANRGLEPRKLSGLVRGELDWIVMKSLEKDRGRRYETANGLAMDVQRYLDDETVHACPPSALYRFRKFARRNKRALSGAAVLAVAALVGITALAASTILVSRANKELSASVVRERRAADQERREAYFQRITVAHRELLFSDNLRSARRVLDECPQDLRTWEWYYLMRLCSVEPLVIKDTREVTSVSFRSDGERIASSCADGTVKIWNSKTGQRIQSFKANEGWTHSVTFHPSGNYVATSGEDKLFRVWDISDGHAVEVFQGPCDAVHLVGTAYAVAFSPDGTRLAAGGDGALNIWDWRKRERLHTFPYGGQRAPTVAFSRDGRRLASGTWGGGIQIWDAEKGGTALLNIPEDHYPVTALAFSPDGERLAQVGHGRRVNVWSTTTGALVHSMPHTGGIACVAYSPDGERIASAGEDKTVRLWEATSGREVLGLRGHLEWCLCVTFSPDGRRLASVGTDQTIRVWDATPLRGDERQEKFTFTQHEDEVWRVAVSPDGRQIASGGFRNPVRVWDAQTGQVAFQFNGHPFVSFDLSWQPDATRIASAGYDGAQFTTKVFDARTGHDVFTIPGDKEVFAVAFSPDRQYLLTAGMNRAIKVFDAKDGRAIVTLGEHAREIRCIAFSRDGRTLASASGDGIVKLWDATRLTEKQEPRFILRARVPGQCLNIAFSPDGKRLATGGDANTVKIWDVPSGRELQTLRGHTADVYAIAFSPDDGRLIASAGEDSTVKIWDGGTGELVRSFRGHEALVGSVAFSPDGRRLYSASRDHTVKVWDLTQLAEPEARKAGGP